MSEHDERERFALYRLCECPECAGAGKLAPHLDPVPKEGGGVTRRCPECRGEGRIRQEVASCADAQAVGVALVTLAREGEFEGCQFGLLDRSHECPECEGSGTGWHMNSKGGRSPHHCPSCGGKGTKPNGTWLILPWPSTARTLSAAGRLLRSAQD